MRAFTILACLVGTQFLSGCLYLHSASLQKASDAAKAEFDAMVLAAPSATAISGYFSDSELTTAVVRDVHRLDRETQLATLLDQTWDQVLTRTSEELRIARGQLEPARSDKNTAEIRLKTALAKVADAKKEVDSYVDALNAASRASARYAATQALLAEALTAAVDRTREGSFDALRQALDRSIAYDSYTRTASGTLKAMPKAETAAQLLGVNTQFIPAGKPKSVEDVEKLVGALGTLPAVSESLTKNLTFRSPGIATTIVGLGFDVARAAEREALAAVQMAKQEIDLRESQMAFLEAHVKRLEQDLDKDKGVGLAAAATLESDHGRPIRSTLGRLIADLQQSAPPDQRLKSRGLLHLAYLALATNFKVRVVDAKEREIFEDRVSALLPQRALSTATVRLALREAVIGRGLEGLVAFHTGGLTPDDFSRVLGIAQTVGIFIIAGGQ